MSGGSFHPLVPGTIREIFEGQKPTNVWLQVIFIKPIEKEGGSGTRYKVAVSDSKNFIQAMVVSPLSLAFEQHLVEQWSIIKVTSYQLNSMKGHTFMVLGNMSQEEVIRVGQKYGEPTNIEQASQKPTINPNTDSIPITISEIPRVVTVSPPSLTTTTITTTFPPPQPSTTNNLVNKTTTNPFQSNISELSTNKQSFTSNNYGSTSLTSGSNGFYEEPESFQTISNLSPYHNRWTIKARIVNKSDIKKFANAKGEGKLFSATCIDNSGEIRMTAFGDSVDKFFDMVREGQIYYISNAQVKIAKRQFGVRNEYEIHLEPNSLVTLAREGESGGESLPSIRYSFIPISQILNLEKDSNCDIIGVMKESSELSSILTKTTQKTLSKRDLTIVDSSNCSIKVTLWGSQAENFIETGGNNYPIVAIKGARVSDYNGRTLSTNSVSTITINPDIREAHELRGWFDSQGVHESSKSLSMANSGTSLLQAKDDRKFINQIREEFLGSGEKPDYFSILGSIVYVKSDGSISYTACPTEGCNKKVFEDGPNMWKCEKCQKVYDRCDHRYILSLQIGDHTGQTWVNTFNETGEALIGKSAEEMYYLRMNDELSYSNIFKDALFKQYLFRIRAKQENYQGEMKLRCNVISALPVNPVEESKLLIEKIQNLI